MADDQFLEFLGPDPVKANEEEFSGSNNTEENDIVLIAKEQIDVFERPSRKISEKLIQEVEALRYQLNLAEKLINKIDDKKYRQMINSYKTFNAN